MREEGAIAGPLLGCWWSKGLLASVKRSGGWQRRWNGRSREGSGKGERKREKGKRDEKEEKDKKKRKKIIF